MDRPPDTLALTFFERAEAAQLNVRQQNAFLWPNLDFYALGDDLRRLFEFLYSETDIVAYELSSEFDREPRCFRSLAEVEVVFSLGMHGAGHLQLWSPSVMERPVIRRIELRVPGHSSYAVEGAGLMQLYLDGIKDRVIYYSHFGHFSQAGARQRSIHSVEDCNWHALAKLSGRIEKHIRRKLASAKLYACPILQ